MTAILADAWRQSANVLTGNELTDAVAVADAALAADFRVDSIDVRIAMTAGHGVYRELGRV